jgi:hypothetical protein
MFIHSATGGAAMGLLEVSDLFVLAIMIFVIAFSIFKFYPAFDKIEKTGEASSALFWLGASFWELAVLFWILIHSSLMIFIFNGFAWSSVMINAFLSVPLSVGSALFVIGLVQAQREKRHKAAADARVQNEKEQESEAVTSDHS